MTVISDTAVEFIRTLSHTPVDADSLKRTLTLARLPELCASIDTSQPENDNEGDIYCLWGAFRVRRDELVQGVRFSLLNCPHALAWTVTRAPDDGVVVHCTIDKTLDAPEFVESIEQFVGDWAEGVHRFLQSPAG